MNTARGKTLLRLVSIKQKKNTDLTTVAGPRDHVLKSEWLDQNGKFEATHGIYDAETFQPKKQTPLHSVEAHPDA